MKTKTIIICLALMFVMGIVVAEGISYIRYSIDLAKEQSNAMPSNDEIITFSCGGKSMEISGSEPDGVYDENDIKTLAINSGCLETATDFRNSKGEYFEKIGSYTGFDSTEKKMEECKLSGEIYNDKANRCEKVIGEPPIGETEDIV